MSRVQYGDLIRDASRHMLSASLAVEDEVFASQAAALAAAAAYRDLLHALYRHGEVLGTTDPAGFRLVEALAAVADRNSSACDGPWAAAASSVRAATDMLATHRDRYGGWRTPEAAVLETDAVRDVGFGELAALSAAAASSADQLGLHLCQQGVEQVELLVPYTRPLLEVALEVRSAGRGLRPPLETLEVACPAIRLGDPVVELGDRLGRLHRVAWQLTRQDQVGMCTLADLAVAGVVVNEFAARLVPSPEFTAGGQAWRSVHQRLRTLRSLTPAASGVRADVMTVRKLLDQVAVGPSSIRVEGVVVEGARAFADVAVWNAQVLDYQDKTGQVLVPGRCLTGNEVSDHPPLVVAKLKNQLARAPQGHLEPLREAYRAVSATVVLDEERGQLAPSLRCMGPRMNSVLNAACPG